MNLTKFVSIWKKDVEEPSTRYEAPGDMEELVKPQRGMYACASDKVKYTCCQVSGDRLCVSACPKVFFRIFFFGFRQEKFKISFTLITLLCVKEHLIAIVMALTTKDTR
jgi:hypothetical protein